MKRFIILLSLTLCCIISYAQASREILHLKNGTKLEGYVLEEVYGESVTIQTLEGAKHTIPISDITKKTRTMVGAIMPNDNVNATILKSHSLNKGYRFFFSGGLGFKFTEYSSFKFEASTSHGYQFNPHLFVGGGLALQFWGSYLDFSAQVYAKIRWDILKGNRTPFLSLRVGHGGFLIADTHGKYIAPTIGYRLSDRLNLGISYELTRCDESKLSGYEEDDDYYIKNRQNMASIMLKVGFDIGARK